MHLSVLKKTLQPHRQWQRTTSITRTTQSQELVQRRFHKAILKKNSYPKLLSQPQAPYWLQYQIFINGGKLLSIKIHLHTYYFILF